MSKYKILNAVLCQIVFLLSCTLLCAQDDAGQSFLNKARKVKAEERQAVKNLTYNNAKQHSTNNNADSNKGELPAPELDYDASIESSTLSLIRTGNKDITYVGEIPSSAAVSENGSEKKAKKENTETVKNEDKPDAITSIKEPQFKKTEQKAPVHNSHIKWIDSSTRNFIIKVEPHTSGIMTPNLGMKFETVYQVLSKNISWMLSGKANVYVYQNRHSFLHNEPVASNWSGAFFSPEDNRIVMYDEPNNADNMMAQFSHELTHLFVENFFNPPGEAFTLEPPIWLNEGLAVNIEDISADFKGGVWANDLIVINILSSAEKKALLSRLKNKQKFSDNEKKAVLSNIVTGKTVSFVKFSDFIKNESYDRAEQKGDVENWYFQAYAMVRFLFRQKNTAYADKRMQFEQFTKLLKTFEDKKDANGNIIRDKNGKPVKKRISTEYALRKAYGFKDMQDFENRFWKWLREMQTQERQKIKLNINGQ